MSFNKITFGEKKLGENTLQKINFCFSNGHKFDIFFYKNKTETHLVLERKYVSDIMKYSFANGGTYDPQVVQMFLPMISMMFLPINGVFNLSKLGFDEIYAGAMKTNLSKNLSNAFSGNAGANALMGTSTDFDSDSNNSQSLIGSLFSNLKEVWKNDDEDEEEELDDFLVDEKISSDIKEISDDTKEMFDDTKEDVKEVSDGAKENVKEDVKEDIKIDIPKENVLFDISLKIDEDTDFVSRINEKDPNEMYETGRQKLLKDFKEYEMSGIKNIEFFGENNENTRLTLSYEFDDVVYEYNVEDMIQIKDFLLKFCSFIKSEDIVFK